jgi:hypothetical protein
MVVTSKINVDLRNRYINTVVDAVQYDVNSRIIEVSLFEGGIRKDVSAESTFEVRFKRGDGATGSYAKLNNGNAAVERTESNILSVWLSDVVLSVSGVAVISVCIKDGEKEINTFSFDVNVEKNPASSKDAKKYPDTYDATATPQDIIPGKTAYVNGEKIVGSAVVSVFEVSDDGSGNVTIVARGGISATNDGRGNAYIS